MSRPSARVILDSVSPEGARIVTIEAKMHRFVLPEFNTHRAFSRNSASSRAIPIAKRISEVRNNPALPVRWGANGKGMQDHGDLSPEDAYQAKAFWREAANHMADFAERLSYTGLHKQWTNRLLEPFLWHTVIVTATDWANFYYQRCHADAQPEIRAVAEAMRAAHLASVPVERVRHLPYVDGYDLQELEDAGINPWKVCVARCARVSYLTHDGRRDPQADLDLFGRLLGASPPHLSPFEHAAMAIPSRFYRSGNLKGWVSERVSCEDEFPTPNLEVPWETRP